MRTAMIDEFVRCLELVVDHPDWIRKVVPHGQELGYISGVGLGVRFIFDLPNDPRERTLRHAAAEARGWVTDRHPYEQMLERGFSTDEIMSELARLEIEFVRMASKLA